MVLERFMGKQFCSVGLVVSFRLSYPEIKVADRCPSLHLLVQSQKLKHQKKVGNLFKVNDKDTKTTSRRRSGVFIVNTEQISHIVVMFLLLTLNKEMPAGVRQMLSIKIE